MARRVITTEIETYPEADRLEGFPHPRATRRLFGHDAERADLATAIDTGKLHHAWMLSGPEGIGKATFAYHAARYALASADQRTGPLDVSPESSVARQVDHLSHPGLLVIRRAYDIKTKRFPAAITVDAVRRLRGFLNHRAAPQAWRAIVVDRADELNVNAANALLKSLEEPPARTLFFLVTLEPGRLLPTIRSRCRLLAFQPLNMETLITAAKQAYDASDEPADPGPAPDWDRLAAGANGSVRRLLQLATPGGKDLTAMVGRVLAMAGQTDWQFGHDVADRLAPAQAQPDYELFLDLLHERLAQLIRARAGHPATPADQALALQLISSDGLASWVDLWETLHRERLHVQALNLDRSAFLLDIFARMQRAASTDVRS